MTLDMYEIGLYVQNRQWAKLLSRLVMVNVMLIKKNKLHFICCNIYASTCNLKLEMTILCDSQSLSRMTQFLI